MRKSMTVIAAGLTASAVAGHATGTAADIERVEVGGAAVVVARGEFRLP